MRLLDEKNGTQYSSTRIGPEMAIRGLETATHNIENDDLAALASLSFLKFSNNAISNLQARATIRNANHRSAFISKMPGSQFAVGF
jgi:hypothetical protein